MQPEEHDSAKNHDPPHSSGVIKLCDAATVLPSIVYEKKKQAPLCEHGRQKCRCTECLGTCQHGRGKWNCVECGAPPHKAEKLCGHGKRRSRCLDCVKACVHGRIEKLCKDCGFKKKQSVKKKCIHNKIKSCCDICSSHLYCCHKRKIYKCVVCNGGGICSHSKVKANCKVCQIPASGVKRIYKNCQHDIPRNNCKICGWKNLCIHNRRESTCRDCNGSSICTCGKLKYYCRKHGGSALCSKCQLYTANPKYDKHCADCFVNYYPEDPRSDRNSKLKRRETVVREAIDAAFQGFTHDKSFYTSGCCDHRRRIDHRLLIHGTVLAIETDENAHVSYNKEDEIIRYDDIFMAIGTKFIFIRFNCDTNREECGAKTSLEHKIHALLDCITIQIARIEKNENKELCDIVKLFYCALCSKNGSDVCQCL